MQLFFIVARRRFFDLHFDLFDAFVDGALFARAADDRRIVFVDFDGFRFAEHIDFGAFEFNADFFGNHLSAGQNRDVLQHILSSVAEAGRFYRAAFNRAADRVEYERRERLSVDVFSDDDKCLSFVRDFFENREQVFHRGDFFVVNQNIRVVVRGFHAFAVGNEIR